MVNIVFRRHVSFLDLVINRFKVEENDRYRSLKIIASGTNARVIFY